MLFIDKLIQEMEYELDRITLYKDAPSEATLEVMLRRWISFVNKAFEELTLSRQDPCLDHDQEIKELREALSESQAKLEAIKEIL